MEKKFSEYGELNDAQKAEAVDLFLEGFGHFLTFSKDEAAKKNLFIEIFDPDFFICYLEDDKVLGLMGLGTNKKRPIDFKKEICQKYFIMILRKKYKNQWYLSFLTTQIGLQNLQLNTDLKKNLI